MATTVIQALVDGLLIGGVYAAIGLGLSLAYGVMGVVNWAHGEVLMVSMFISLYMTKYAGVDLNGDYIQHGELAPVTPIDWTPEQIFTLADRFSEDTPLHKLTGATHSCFLARGSELLFSCEDIGRHNALDKAIGFALRHDIDLTGCIAYSSGRLPTDMVEKAIRAGLPVLCTKASPTAEAVALAQSCGLTLIGCARPQHLRQYTAPTKLTQKES